MRPPRWHDPFRDLATLQERMNRIFEETLARSPRHDEEVFAGTWSPPVDIGETKEKIVLRAELAGLTSDDVQIQFEDGVLTLSGERRPPKESEEETFHRVERSYGKFRRSFSIPGSVDPSLISARFDDGLLTIDLPKRAVAQPKRITVQVGSAPPAVDVKTTKG